ncbi:MAG: hypothetical protein EON93_07895, partial [Burkholderiales bacterium]
GIFLKLNSLRVLRDLGIHDTLASQGTWIREAQLWGHNGTPILQRSLPAAAVLTVRREDIHQALVNSARNLGVAIRTATEVSRVDVQGNVQVKGERAEAYDLVVGADGVGSVVRESIGLTRSVQPTGAGSWRALMPQREIDPQDQVIEFWRGHRRILVAPAGPGRTYICASSRDDDVAASSGDFPHAVWTQSFPEFADLISRVANEGTTRRQHLKVAVRGWHRGRVAILGDAVHGQPPNLGQGAGCAIANGAALAACLTETATLEEALLAWERRQRELTEDVQSWSNLYDSIVHSWPSSLELGREALVWGIGKFAPTRARWSRLSAGLAASAR